MLCHVVGQKFYRKYGHKDFWFMGCYVTYCILAEVCWWVCLKDKSVTWCCVVWQKYIEWSAIQITVLMGCDAVYSGMDVLAECYNFYYFNSVMPCSLVQVCWCVKATCCLHLWLEEYCTYHTSIQPLANMKERKSTVFLKTWKV